jgi:hypothetical protein
MKSNKRPAQSANANGLLPGEHSDIRQEIAAVIPDSERWLDTPNDRLGGAKPDDLIGTYREQFIRDMIRAYKLGIPT